MTRIVEWEGAPEMCTGAPMPVLVACEKALFVAYLIHDEVEMGSASTSLSEQWAVVSFDAAQYTFGYPNDEALSTHPLFKHGLHPYIFNLVESSPSVRGLAGRNKLLFPEGSEEYSSMQHWIITCHDETLEVIASAVKVHGVLGASSGVEAIEYFRSFT